ncbi:MAG: DUF5666 domain-containing protein [Gammaproteobacteria bacterium]|nr:DUF5666 domain-containing protein [Gammaproteobacteria bacterium]
MKMIRPPIAYLLASALSLAGCEGGGITGTGFDKLPVSVGVITNFGSIYVNGIKFATSAESKVKLDDVIGSENDLKIGMVVSIAGSINADGLTGAATQIIFADDVEGSVLSNNIATISDPTDPLYNTLNIMGQTIHVDADTTFESNIDSVLIIDDIQPGNIVEVSGFNSGDGHIYATRIEAKKAAYVAGEDIEVTGLIKSTTSTTFQIGSLTVLYGNAELADIPNNTIKDGLFVEVKSKQGINTDGQLVADKIELEGDGTKKFEVQVDQKLELEGIISQFDAAKQTFVLNGQLVSFDSTSPLAQLGDGVKIKVDGNINADGVLVVSKYEAKKEANVQVSAFVESVDASKNTLVILGQTIQLSTSTTMNDEKDVGNIRKFTISDIKAGDYVRVSAFYDPSASAWQATKLERDDAEDEQVELQGIIINSTPESGLIEVAGVSIDISALTEFNVSIGDEVDIEGTYSNGSIIAGEESEFESRGELNGAG